MGLGTREVTEISATGAVDMATQTRPMQFRLPRWAGDFIEQRAAMRGTSKTAVVLEAIECLEKQDAEALMRAGYEEMNQRGRRMAESDMAATAEALPEW